MNKKDKKGVFRGMSTAYEEDWIELPAGGCSFDKREDNQPDSRLTQNPNRGYGNLLEREVSRVG